MNKIKINQNIMKTIVLIKKAQRLKLPLKIKCFKNKKLEI
jgi:hypothetical protein